MVNVFTISNDDLNTIGLGLYLGLSVLDHSCDPDAFVLFNGTKAVLRPLKQYITAYDSSVGILCSTEDFLFKRSILLSVLDHSCDPDAFVLFNGTKAVLRPLKQYITAYDSSLRIAYCDLLDLTSMRRNQLKQQFFFTCECSACLDLEREKTARSVRCRHCVDGYCPLDVNENSLVCWQCGATSEVHVDEAVHLMQQVEWEVKRLQERRNDSICTAKDLYNEASIILSSLNIPLCQLADRIASWGIDNGNFSLAADYIEKTISCFKRFYPTAHPSLSLQYFKAGKLHSLNDLTLELAAERLEQAIESLHASHGVQHSLSAEAHELLCKVQQQRRDLENQRVRPFNFY
uniref:SET domain-containing protein n=1 Tax=Ascaris lumbricoides TaxID=6252 RepID=A0A0M3IDH7_ASCLU